MDSLLVYYLSLGAIMLAGLAGGPWVAARVEPWIYKKFLSSDD